MRRIGKSAIGQKKDRCIGRSRETGAAYFKDGHVSRWGRPRKTGSGSRIRITEGAQ